MNAADRMESMQEFRRLRARFWLIAGSWIALVAAAVYVAGVAS